MLSFLTTYYRKASARYFAKNTLAKSITAIAFLVVLGGFAVIVHEGFYYGFRYMLRDAFFGQALSLYVIELFLLVSSYLTFTSALVSGVVSLFRDEEGGVVMASPTFSLKPTLVLSRMFFSSLWPLLAVIIPALIAIMRVFPLTPLGFVLALLASVLLIFVAVVLAMLTLLGIAKLLSLALAFSKLRLTLATSAAFLALTFLIGRYFHSIDLVTFFQARLLSKNVPDLLPILDQFHFFPSHLITMIIYGSEIGMPADAALHFVGLLALAGALLVMFLRLRDSHLLYWQLAQEHRRHGERVGGGALHMTLYAKVASPKYALFIKEFTLFIRNTRGMLWLSFILIIWGIQSASSIFLKHGLGAERVSGAELPAASMAFQFALIAYFVSMFALRFAFPSFSEEHKSSWVVGSSPLSSPGVFWAKWTFFSTIFGLFALFFALLNAGVTGIPASLMPLLLVLVALSSLTITTFALALGAIFPNSETDDPEVLSTSLPGLAFIITSLCYGSLGALAFHAYLSQGSVFGVALFVACSLSLVSVLIIRARISLTKAYAP